MLFESPLYSYPLEKILIDSLVYNIFYAHVGSYLMFTFKQFMWGLF